MELSGAGGAGQGGVVWSDDLGLWFTGAMKRDCRLGWDGTWDCGVGKCVWLTGAMNWGVPARLLRGLEPAPAMSPMCLELRQAARHQGRVHYPHHVPFTPHVPNAPYRVMSPMC